VGKRVGKTLWLASSAASALALLLPAIASAQTTAQVPTADSGIRSFPPAFFADFSPVTALDMVERIPGFSIEEGEGRRGFGENAINVLIDGDRPSTKSENLRTILGRIPASQVDRIELIEQAGADGETRGAGQIVNVIRKVSGAVSGTYDGNIRVGTRYGATAFANGSATLKRGKTTFELNAGSFEQKLQGSGPEDFQDGSRRLIERRVYNGRSRFTEYNLGGAVRTQIGSAKVNANAKIAYRDGIDRRLGRLINPAGVDVGIERLFTDQPKSELSYEAGADIEFPLAPKLTTKLIGLYRTEAEDFDGLLERVRPGQDTTLFLSRNRNRPSEAVFRVQNDWSGVKNHAIQFGAEIAYNRLDAAFDSDSRVGTAPPSLSAFDVLVRETRIEPFVSDVWTLSPAWKIEAGAIAEFSKLRLTGGSQARRSFQFIKPRVAATWTASKATTVELRAENQVAQLDFDEFATSVDLGQGNQVDSGNRDLVPERIWTLSALVRQKFLDRGSIQLLGSYQFVSDTQDLVPVDLGNGIVVDGAGNIGSSRRWNAELEITLPLDWATKPLGITGMELRYVGHYHGSRVTDPVTGAKRRVSFRPEWHQDWTFRHDISKAGVAYGFVVRASAPSDAFFVSQFRSQIDELEIDNAFIEYNRFKLGTVRLSVFDPTGSAFRRARFLYSGTRASGVITDIIERRRELDPRIQLSLSGKF
jgi:outer membrane receptor protein involved in Fe transport